MSGQLPTFLYHGHSMTQSVAILEFLEESGLGVPLLPTDPGERAQVRSIVLTIACDIHPLQNLNVLEYIGQERKAEWVHLCFM